MLDMGFAPGKRNRLYDGYIEKRRQLAAGELEAEEAMSTSDFPTYLGKFLRHTFLERFQEVQGSWQQYTRDFSVEDFEEYTSSRFGRFSDIEQKPLNGQYNQLTIKEYSAEKIRLYEWGNAFSITRQLVIADRLNKIKDLPGLLAEALARTMSKRAAVTKFQANPAMDDGQNLFSAAHSNLLDATALTANTTGATEVKEAILKLAAQTDDEGYKIVTPGTPHTIIHPVEYRFIVKALMTNELLPNGSSQLEVNEVRGMFNTIEEPFFTDTNNWYMASDLKGSMGFLAHITLNGNTVPFLGLKDPGVRAVMGGDDPYSFEFDEIAYKLRHDFEFKPVEWRGIVGAFPS